ncbi:MAG: 23S rRNA pseudouridine(1911/1915/1917) synthase RluD [Xanthomonadales bacterium]|nr:23S rRNA pseudouridine(1911/1915/1917) synthase RluD [Xanthomonadales bacterium]
MPASSQTLFEQLTHAPAVARIQLHAQTDKADAGKRLDQVAARLFAEYSRGQLQKWIRSGELTVNGQEQKPTYKVLAGVTLVVDAQPEARDETQPQDIPLDLLYSDDDVLVLNKPAGIVVHPAAGNRDGTLQNALLHFDPNLAVLPRSGLVHRLDKDTSGVMVVARSLRAHTSLVMQLQARSMSRIYEAVAAGEIRRRGTVDEPIGRHPRDRKRMAVVTGGKKAVSHFRILQPFKGFTHIEVSLQTGRTHQIRVHMAHLGHPLVGDATYGRKPRSVRGMDAELVAAIKAFPRQALHARFLTFQHPADQREMRFEAALPQDMLDLLGVLQAKAKQ